ncbi:lytic transglycosylase domain-containing protein [Xanthomonas campestris]|uniref:lytic transglycosylase domain-containing protein n=1 Tax=Xanthomonas campestris TaxID=339 RepID=UPI002AD2561E|nr:lytic transglycosylase domain-containing protein [Xanthomonas campestris]
MLPGIEMMACGEMAAPLSVMQHVVHVESSHNPYAIGVVGGRLVRQPKNLGEALSTVQMLQEKGYNFSLGLAQVNRYNLSKYGLQSYEQAFQQCPNLKAGSAILSECYQRSGKDWGKALSCYYSGNFVTGFRHGYVQKVFNSMAQANAQSGATPIPLLGEAQGPVRPPVRSLKASFQSLPDRLLSRVIDDRPQSAAPLAQQDAAQVFPQGAASIDAKSVRSDQAGALGSMPQVQPSAEGDTQVADSKHRNFSRLPNRSQASPSTSNDGEVAVLMSSRVPVILGAPQKQTATNKPAPVAAPSQQSVKIGDAAFVF